jgi:hypothetical protein
VTNNSPGSSGVSFRGLCRRRKNGRQLPCFLLCVLKEGRIANADLFEQLLPVVGFVELLKTRLYLADELGA